MAKKSKKQVPDPSSLTSSPFAALGGLVRADLPEGPKAAPIKEAPKGPAKAKAPYKVGKSKKGNFAIAIERRSGGKTVTVLSKVSGDGKALLKALKGKLGTGGTVKEDKIELQGDHRTSLGDALKALL